MPAYRYEALNAAGKSSTGLLEADILEALGIAQHPLVRATLAAATTEP